MKISTRNLMILLGILILAFVAVQLTKRSGRSKSLRTELVSVDTSAVSRIEVSSPTGGVTLNKRDRAWYVELSEGEKRAKSVTVNQLLRNLNTIKPSRLAARKEDKWRDYEVDSTGRRVTVFNNQEVVADIVLGRIGVEGERNFYTFVRLFEEENVYAANKFMKMSVSEDPSSYRENSVIKLSKDSLMSVSFSYPDSSFLLDRSDQWYVDGAPADSAAVATYFQALRILTSRGFYDKPLSADASHTITFSFSNEPPMVVEGFYTTEGIIIKSSSNKNEVFLDEQASGKLFKGKGVFSATL